MSLHLENVGHLLRAVRAHLHRKYRRRKYVARDPRHAIRAPLLYRQRGGLFWYNGILEDFSVTGVRFRGERYLPLQCPLEMSFAVPREFNGAAKVNFFCWGKVARTALPSLSDGQFGIGAQILRYRSEQETALDFRGIIGEVRGPSAKSADRKHPPPKPD
jgi:hypothetical protein